MTRLNSYLFCYHYQSANGSSGDGNCLVNLTGITVSTLDFARSEVLAFARSDGTDVVKVVFTNIIKLDELYIAGTQEKETSE